MDRNGNDNCLAGIQCPQCSNATRFLIDGSSQFRLTDDGAEQEGDIFYDDDSVMWCDDCGRTAPMRDFFFGEEENEGSNVENSDAGRPDDVGPAGRGDQPRGTGVPPNTQHNAERLPEPARADTDRGQRVSCPDTMRRGRNPIG